jgi:hypothetical protein
MRNYKVKEPPFGRSGAPYCVVAYEDALSLAMFIVSRSVAIGLTMTPGSSAMISFPDNTITIPKCQIVVDEWDSQQATSP